METAALVGDLLPPSRPIKLCSQAAAGGLAARGAGGKRKDAEDKPLPSPIAAIDFKSLDTLRVLRLGWRTGVGGTKYVPRYFSWIKGASGCSSSTPALQESTYS